MKKIVSLLLLVLSVILNAQDAKGVLLFKDGTSVEGYGDIKKNKIRFKAELEDEIDTWDHTLVQGVIFANVEYEYVLIQTKSRKPKLLKVIRDGEIRLYADEFLFLSKSKKIKGKNYSTDFSNIGSLGRIEYEESKKNYYIKKQSEKKALGFYRNKKKILLNYFENCDVISDILETKEYRNLTPLQIFDLYYVYCTE
ncbi:hypothetical protein [Tenacibaculum sp. 190524A05c]|uniref:Uncharacterized protein n=1 Tax=Tenacibaculum platacis TaxID=3137852 RepID=A0ABP1ETV7_9FLAO